MTIPRRICSVDECNRVHDARGYCKVHYAKILSSERTSWRHMKHRCLDTSDKYYYMYGAKGISVCERWLEFDNFLEDMGKKPSNTYTLDRINNSLGYFKENCRWADKRTQSINRGMQSNNTSGHVGVIWVERGHSWKAQIYNNGKKINIGHFKNIEEAAKAYSEAKLKYHALTN